MISTSDFKTGMTLIVDKHIFQIVNFQHVKPGKGGAFVRTKLKNVRTGQVLEKTYRAGEKFEQAIIEEKRIDYLYSDHLYHFMDAETYEQVTLAKEILEDVLDLLKENTRVTAKMHGGECIGVTLPTFLELKVVKTDPGFKGDTVSGATKPATVETGAVIQVPLHVNEGNVIKIDTRKREYVSRV